VCSSDLTALSKDGRVDQDGRVERFNFKEVGWVLGSAVLFGVLLVPAGSILSVMVLVLVSMMGSHEFRWRDAIIMAFAMATLVYCVFIWGLSVTIPVWPAFMDR
jgi:hypothetical protein